jgi:hypothetical protein
MYMFRTGAAIPHSQESQVNGNEDLLKLVTNIFKR